ncbi:MAG: hypothetical protein Kow00108_23860 [Calditrichia bacterium]
MVSFNYTDPTFRRVKPYEIVSLFYDDMMEHVNYREWAEYVELLINRYNLPYHDLLEIAAGTGKFADYFSYPMVGMDRYLPMLKKYKQRHPDHQVVVEKMPELKSIKAQSFSGVLILYDSINYIVPGSDWRLFFEKVNDILKPEGWLLFDIVTQYCCKKYFMDDMIEEQFRDIHYKRIIKYDEGNSIQHNFFFVTTEFGKFMEHHRQFIPNARWITSELKRSGFKKIYQFHEFSLKNPNSRSLRIHFLARK